MDLLEEVPSHQGTQELVLPMWHRVKMPGCQRVTQEILTLEMKEGTGSGKPGKRDPTAQTPGKDFCFAGTRALENPVLLPLPLIGRRGRGKSTSIWELV